MEQPLLGLHLRQQPGRGGRIGLEARQAERSLDGDQRPGSRGRQMAEGVGLLREQAGLMGLPPSSAA
jgi:hypothetical protein